MSAPGAWSQWRPCRPKRASCPGYTLTWLPMANPWDALSWSSGLTWSQKRPRTSGPFALGKRASGTKDHPSTGSFQGSCVRYPLVFSFSIIRTSRCHCSAALLSTYVFVTVDTNYTIGIAILGRWLYPTQWYWGQVYLRCQVPRRELPVDAYRTGHPVHGQCWTQHKRITGVQKRLTSKSFSSAHISHPFLFS